MKNKPDLRFVSPSSWSSLSAAPRRLRQGRTVTAVAKRLGRAERAWRITPKAVPVSAPKVAQKAVPICAPKIAPTVAPGVELEAAPEAAPKAAPEAAPEAAPMVEPSSRWPKTLCRESLRLRQIPKAPDHVDDDLHCCRRHHFRRPIHLVCECLRRWV